MHAITSLIALVGAGRQSKAIHTPSSNIIHIDGANGITGLIHVQVAQNKPVVQSPVQKTATLKPEDKEARSPSLTFKDGWLAAAAVFKKWKTTGSVAKKDKASPIPSADAAYVQELFQNAVWAANRIARLELKASTSGFCTAEQFDVTFPPSLQYISKACEKEILENILKMLASGK